MTTINRKQPMRPAEIDLLNQVDTNTADIATQTARLAQEIDRAKGAEQANATAISDETTARTDADKGLQNSINEINAKFPVQAVNIGDAQVTVAKLEQTIQAQLTFLQSVPAQEFGTSNAIDVQANSNTSINISFGRTKTKVPIVLCGLQHASDDISYIITGVTNQQFSVTVHNHSSTDVSGITIDWLAISGR